MKGTFDDYIAGFFVFCFFLSSFMVANSTVALCQLTLVFPGIILPKKPPKHQFIFFYIYHFREVSLEPVNRTIRVIISIKHLQDAGLKAC